MLANQLRPPAGSRHARKRVGRGNASGHGTYSTKGLKGQKARSGAKPRRFFEGGQTEFMRKLPRKKGFTNHFRTSFTAVNLRDLERFEDGSEVTPEALKAAGVVSSLSKPVKLLATGEISKKLTVRVHRISMAAQEAIEAAGGSVEVMMPRVKKERVRKKAKKGKGTPPKAAEAAAEGEPEAGAEKETGEKEKEESRGDSG